MKNKCLREIIKAVQDHTPIHHSKIIGRLYLFKKINAQRCVQILIGINFLTKKFPGSNLEKM